jgi:hypothetical protein
VDYPELIGDSALFMNVLNQEFEHIDVYVLIVFPVQIYLHSQIQHQDIALEDLEI